MSEYLAITYELRRAGIPAEIHLGKPKRLGKQLQRADRLAIPYVVIMGGDEAGRGVVTLKEMEGRPRKKQRKSRVTKEWKISTLLVSRKSSGLTWWKNTGEVAGREGVTAK